MARLLAELRVHSALRAGRKVLSALFAFWVAPLTGPLTLLLLLKCAARLVQPRYDVKQGYHVPVHF